MEQSANPSDQVYDVIIIGGGPAGSTAAIYTARAQLSTLVVDKGLTAGALGMAGKLANWPGTPGEVPGVELLTRMREQAQGFGAAYAGDKVMFTELSASPKQVWGNKGGYYGRTVIIATGSMGRGQGVPGEERLVGLGVSYCATCDGAFFHERVVAAVGSSDEAAEEALFLTRFARKVYLICPTPELRAVGSLAAEIAHHPKIELRTSTRLREVLGADKVEAVRVADKSGAEETIPVEGAFIFLQGQKPITDFLGEQLPKSEAGCLAVDEMMQTAIPGVFAVGDVLCTHIKQAVIAAAEGARAGIAVQRYLSGREKLKPDWGA